MLLLFALPANAETDEGKLNALTEKMERALERLEQLEKSRERRGKSLELWERLSLDLYLRERFELRGNATFDSPIDDSLSFVVQRVRLGVGFEIVPKRFEVYVQIQDVRLWGLERATISNDNNLDLHQGYLLFKDVGWAGLDLKVGRQKMMFGNQRLVSINNWNTLGRSFDQVRVTYSAPKYSVDAWAALTKETDVTVDHANFGLASNTIVPKRANKHGILESDQVFFGTYGTMKVLPRTTIEPYVMYLRDGRDAGMTDRPFDKEAKDRKQLTLGGRVSGKVQAGNGDIDLDFEGAVQAGSVMDPRLGRRLDIDPGRTYFLYGIIGYTWKAPFSPRIGFEYNRYSGDNNPSDDKFSTWDPLFPTGHKIMGFMDLVGARNTENYKVSVSVRPTKTSQLLVKYHMFALIEQNDFWYRAGRQVLGRRAGQPGSTRAGAPATGPDFAGGEVLVKGNRIGDELDIRYRQTFWGLFRLEIGHSWFFPNEVGSSTGGAAPSNWTYVSGVVRY